MDLKIEEQNQMSHWAREIRKACAPRVHLSSRFSSRKDRGLLEVVLTEAVVAFMNECHSLSNLFDFSLPSGLQRNWFCATTGTFLAAPQSSLTSRDTYDAIEDRGVLRRTIRELFAIGLPCARMARESGVTRC